MNFSFAHASDAPICGFLFRVSMGDMSIFWIRDEYMTLRYQKGVFFFHIKKWFEYAVSTQLILDTLWVVMGYISISLIRDEYVSLRYQKGFYFSSLKSCLETS